jgi:hypothetical protein
MEIVATVEAGEGGRGGGGSGGGNGGVVQQRPEWAVHSGRPVKLRKCTYTGHCAAVWSVEHAIQVLDEIGALTDSEDCLPFAIRLVENGELIQIAEDNGEFACGDLLSECLSKLDKYNVLVCVSRKIIDSFVLDMYQRQKYNCIREAASSAVDLIHDHFTGLQTYTNRIPESEDERSVIVRLPIPSAEIFSNPVVQKEKEKLRATAPVSRVSIDITGMLPETLGFSAGVGDSAHKQNKLSVTRRKLRESLQKSKTMI